MTTNQSALYRIRIEGHLDPSWSDRMGGLAIETDNSGFPPVTTLTGKLVDQSALHGVLNALLELHLPILSTERLSTERESPRAAEEKTRKG